MADSPGGLAGPLALALLPSLALAGCLAPPGPVHDAPGWRGGAPLLESGGLAAAGDAPLLWSGRGAPDVRLVNVTIPPGFWDAHDGALEFSFDVPNATRDPPESDWGQFAMRVVAPGGQAHEAGPSIGAGVVLIPRAASGPYEVVMERVRGTMEYVAAAQVDAWPRPTGEPQDLLPNLVTLAPRDLRIVSGKTLLPLPCLPPGGACAVPTSLPPLPPATGVRGCDAVEAAESSASDRPARRCLRFANGIGNVGPGAFEVHLLASEGAESAAGEGRWMQRIDRSDGSRRDVDAGPAQFHATHGHFHYQRITEFRLHAYDLEAGRRGEPLGEGRKTGFCFSDQHLVALGLPRTHAVTYLTANCLSWSQESLTGDWWSGLGSNWYDRYEWYYPDQYVEVTGLPDGVYELVTLANPDGTVVEADDGDNEAGAVFRLTGDEVEVLATSSGAPGAPHGAPSVARAGGASG